MYFQLGWRNIWRNPRRTIVIMTAIIIGTWSMITLGALMRGISNAMLRNGIATLTGHIQIHAKGYRNDPAVENSISDPAFVIEVLKQHLPPKSQWTERIRVSGIVNNARHSAGITLVGIDPDQEKSLSFIGTAVTEGHFIASNDMNNILVGKALANMFETAIHWKMILMAQDTNKEIESRAFRITGIFQAGMEATEKQFVFITKQAAQEMLKMNDSVSEIAITLPDGSNIDSVAVLLRNTLSQDQYEVHTWKELLPLVVTILNLYDGFILIWFLVIFVAMGFGIVNTILMAVFERIREFGLLQALGMKPKGIVREVIVESFFILLIGTVIGNFVSFLSVFTLYKTGIDLSALAAGSEFVGIPRIIYPVLHIRDIVSANLVIFILGILVSLYPAVKAARFSPTEALAHY